MGTSLLLKACTNNSNLGSTATETQPFKVAAVLTGVITDQSWNQTAYEGINAAKERLGFQFDYVERTPTPDEAEVLADFARRGYNVVIGHGGEFSSPVQQVASQFPNTFFVVTNGGVSSSNIASVQINNLQSGYLAGVIGGLTTQSNQLAFITAKSVRATDQLARSFALGAQAVKPDAKISVSYTGDWDDVAKAKEAALALISSKADVLYTSLDNAFLGVLQAATEQEIYAIGNFVDRLDSAPKAVIVRSAILSVSQGQRDAALSLGMSPIQQSTLVVLPQAIPNMLPAFGNVAIDLLKQTSLVSLITLQDLTFQAQSANQGAFQTVTIFSAVLVIYFVLSLLITSIFRTLEYLFDRQLERGGL